MRLAPLTVFAIVLAGCGNAAGGDAAIPGVPEQTQATSAIPSQPETLPPTPNATSPTATPATFRPSTPIPLVATKSPKPTATTASPPHSPRAQPKCWRTPRSRQVVRSSLRVRATADRSSAARRTVMTGQFPAW